MSRQRWYTFWRERDESTISAKTYTRNKTRYVPARRSLTRSNILLVLCVEYSHQTHWWAVIDSARPGPAINRNRSTSRVLNCNRLSEHEIIISRRTTTSWKFDYGKRYAPNFTISIPCIRQSLKFEMRFPVHDDILRFANKWKEAEVLSKRKFKRVACRFMWKNITSKINMSIDNVDYRNFFLCIIWQIILDALLTDAYKRAINTVWWFVLSELHAQLGDKFTLAEKIKPPNCYIWRKSQCFKTTSLRFFKLISFPFINILILRTL